MIDMNIESLKQKSIQELEEIRRQILKEGGQETNANLSLIKQIILEKKGGEKK